MSPKEARSAVAHLVRRAGFGMQADELDELAAAGYEAAVDQLCTGLTARDDAAEALAPPAFDTAGYRDGIRSADAAVRQAANARARDERRALVLWWLQRMAVAGLPLREKLTLLWHDHFATSLQKVRIAEFMHVHYRTLYDLGPEAFSALADAMARDPAMLAWLDGRESTREAPNENFARELFELFTLGHSSDAHATHGENAPAYTERDVVEAARALTGWSVDRATLQGVLVTRRHDTGTKTVLGRTGALGLSDVVAAAVAHEACAPHVVARLWSRVGRPATASDPVVQDLAGPFARDLDVRALLRRVFLHPAFLEPETRTALVKTPVEWIIGIARALRVPLEDRTINVLAALGQVPFFPPDVAGWPANVAWLSTSSAQVRLQFAMSAARTADIAHLEETMARDRVAFVARLLGVDAWGDTTNAALAGAADEPQTLLTLALVAPENLLA